MRRGGEAARSEKLRTEVRDRIVRSAAAPAAVAAASPGAVPPEVEAPPAVVAPPAAPAAVGRGVGIAFVGRFVGGGVVDGGYDEDGGFAINGGEGWKEVVFTNHQIDLNGPVAIAMGDYVFTNATTGEVAREGRDLFAELP